MPFVKRKINGRFVKINNHYYEVQDSPTEWSKKYGGHAATVAEYLEVPQLERSNWTVAYDGRWHGRIGLFGTYRGEHPFVELHSFPDENGAWPGDTCIGGVFIWTHWKRVDNPSL